MSFFHESTGATNSGATSYQYCKGLADYRQGYFNSALSWMETALSQEGQNPARDLGVHMVAAMSQWKLKDTEKARANLAMGVEIAETKLPKLQDGDLGQDWINWVFSHALLREAKTLIEVNTVTAQAAAQIKDRALSPDAAARNEKLQILGGRGIFFARHAHWKEAAADLARLLELRPNDHLTCHDLAAVLVQDGNVEAYRKHCARSLDFFRNTDDFPTAERIAKDCLILPDSGVDLKEVSKLANFAVSGPTNPALYPWAQLCNGLSEYRLGNCSRSIEWLDPVVAKAGEQNERDVQALMVLAMARWKLRQSDSARAALARGIEIAKNKLAKADDHDFGPSVRDWIGAQALFREARTLIGDQSAASKNSPK